MLSARTYRNVYEVPKHLQTSETGERLSLDDMGLLASRATPLGGWCTKVLTRENDKILDDLLDGDSKLPRGVLSVSNENSVIALVSSAGKLWRGEQWVDAVKPIDATQTIELDEEDVAYVARAFQEGAAEVIFRAGFPLAYISTETPVTAAGEQATSDVPEGSVVVAVVDPVDTDAVLELLAVAPGPQVFRRNAGSWGEDPGWLTMLKSIDPPHMVKIDSEKIPVVASQVDAATEGTEFEPLLDDDFDLYRTVAASGYVSDVRQEADQAAVDLTLGLLAVAGRELSPRDVKNTERLKRYWTVGPGAAKIRWGTPGAWRRCYRNLVKYLGPRVTPGYCTNLSQRLGGHGIATHVGDRRG